MQQSTSSDPSALVSFEQLGNVFDHLQRELDTIARRMMCLKNDGKRAAHMRRLEETAERHLDGMVNIAQHLCKMKAREFKELQIKARVLLALACEDEPATIADQLIRSLCRDIG